MDHRFMRTLGMSMIGRMVSHYQIIEKLGEGGMGEVFKARDTRLGRTVALKFLPPMLTDDPKAKQRFIQEAQAASMLDDPNICTIFEVDETQDGRMFICMAYYPGKTLKEKIAEGALEIAQAVDLAIQTAQGLAKAHAQGIIHRDIKPANILITSAGLAKIVDFGLAKIVGQLKLTATGRTVGTVAYMSPEQARGEEVGPGSDIWALGVILYEMTVGELPFKGEYDAAVMYSIINEEPKSMAGLRSGIPPELEQIVRKALAKNPSERYQAANDLLADLNNLKRRMEFAETSVPPAWKFKGKDLKWRIAPAVAAIVIAALIFAWQFAKKEKSGQSILLGQPWQVTSGDAWNGEPSLSPDGTRIAYTSDESGNRDIFIIGVQGGNPIRLTDDPASDSDPAWFPDSTALAFVSERGGTTNIWKIGQLGGGATLLLPGARDPAISPEGRRIAFCIPDSKGYSRITVAPLNDPSQVKLLSGDSDGLWSHRHPAWSPDGRSICYTAHDSLWIISSSGGSPARRLTSGGEGDFEPTWSSDGRFIYFSSGREGTRALWRIAAKGGAPERSTMGSGSEISPSISRDGSRLVYATRTMRNPMFVRDLDSGRETALPGLRDSCLACLAPDGGRVVYATDRGEKNYNLWVQHLERGKPEGQPQRLTEEQGYAACPTFSADGKWIAYYRIIGEQRDIYTIPASGGKPIRFTDDPAEDTQPAWSPDGSLLAYISERGGASRIWVAPVRDGKPTAPPRCLSDRNVIALAPSWSLDGARIAFVGCIGNRCEVEIIPADGSTPAREITTGANASLVHWEPATGAILVSGTWGEDRNSLRRVFPDTQVATPLTPPVVFGSLEFLATFDVSLNGRLLIFSHEDVKGNIWALRADKRIF
jgi:eukaryotic-like serine/threonine-protein kinase